nr:MAG: major capsid protein [Microviridae sp.]
MPVFPKLKQKAPKRANHDLSHYFRTSMAPGTLVPIYVKPVTPGDHTIIDVESLVNTQALLSPLYGSFSLQIDTYFAGSSLYIPQLWRNGSMRQTDGTLHAPYPTFHPKTGYYVDQRVTKEFRVDPSSLLSYLYFPPGFLAAPASTEDGFSPDSYNAIPLLMYLDIYRHYYVNRQETYAKFITHIDVQNVVVDNVYPLGDLDSIFLELPVSGGDVTSLLERFIDPADQPLGGLCLRTYKPDRMNVILNSEFYEKNVNNVQVNVVDGKFQLDQFATAKKLWTSRNKDAMTSGTFRDWVRVHYGVTPKISDDMPTFIGSTSSDIMFEDIRATTSAKVGEATQYLGDKGSSGFGHSRTRRHHIVADRPGYVMVIASIVPRVDYYQFLPRYASHLDLSDTFRPEYNGIGLQDVLVSDLNADFTGYYYGATGDVDYQDPRKHSVGKQPAWIEYMTAVNRIRGTFCTSEKSWVLARDMRVSDSPDPMDSPVDSTDTSAYVRPSMWNQPFAVQDITAQNFLCQFYIKDRTRSEVLKRLLPWF